LPPLPGELRVNGSLWVNGQQITGNGIQQCSGAVPSSSICIGEDATWSGAYTTVIGALAGSVAGGTAVGSRATVTGELGTAIGFGATAGDPGTAVGAFASATGRDSTALGYLSNAIGADSVAIGAKATAGFDRSVAIGPGATTTAPNQVVIGTPGSSLNLPGVASGGSFAGTKNQRGATRLLTTDGSGNIGTSSLDPNQIETNIRSLGQAVTNAGAIASAFSAVPQVVSDQSELMRCGSGLGGYGSSYAAALGCAVKLNPNSPMHLNAALALTSSVDYGYSSSPSYAGRIGFSFPLGPRRRPSGLSQDQAAELEDLRQQLKEIKNILGSTLPSKDQLSTN